MAAGVERGVGIPQYLRRQTVRSNEGAKDSQIDSHDFVLSWHELPNTGGSFQKNHGRGIADLVAAVVGHMRNTR